MNKRKVNDMVFEALFRQAVVDDFNEQIDSIPPKEQLAKIYSFSPEFEVRMKKLFAKNRRKDFAKAIMLYSRKIGL